MRKINIINIPPIKSNQIKSLPISKQKGIITDQTEKIIQSEAGLLDLHHEIAQGNLRFGLHGGGCVDVDTTARINETGA